MKIYQKLFVDALSNANKLSSKFQDIITCIFIYTWNANKYAVSTNNTYERACKFTLQSYDNHNGIIWNAYRKLRKFVNLRFVNKH